ncbi:MAG TPA: hypothetical protein PKA58_29505, partial [Polyangium sp.]|nr:hypothetical protein [Polyangium sp.]
MRSSRRRLYRFGFPLLVLSASCSSTITWAPTDDAGVAGSGDMGGSGGSGGFGGAGGSGGSGT